MIGVKVLCCIQMEYQYIISCVLNKITISHFIIAILIYVSVAIVFGLSHLVHAPCDLTDLVFWQNRELGYSCVIIDLCHLAVTIIVIISILWKKICPWNVSYTLSNTMKISLWAQLELWASYTSFKDVSYTWVILDGDPVYDLRNLFFVLLTMQ